MSGPIFLTSLPIVQNRSEEKPTEISLVEQHIAEENYQRAVKDLILVALGITTGTSPNLIQDVYDCLIHLLPHLENLENEIYPKIVEPLSQFPALAIEQRQLALHLGQWYLKRENSFSAILCLAKAHLIEQMHSLEKEDIHSHLGQVFIQLFDRNQFQERLDLAKGRGDLSAFNQLLDQIDSLKKYNQTELIRHLYQMAGDTLTTFNPTLRDQLVEMSKRVLAGMQWKEGESKWAIIDYYQAFLKEWRKGFDTHLQADPLTVREFQAKRHQVFVRFFEEILLKEAFTLIGEPPCHYDIRAMGSLGREEACPFSDLEGMILIEDLKHLPYFKKLEECLKLQIALLGETAPTNLPVFSCLGFQHKSGFHLDQDFAVGDPATIAAYQKPKAQEYDPASLEHMLQKTTSLSQSTPELFKTYQSEVKKVLSQADREKRALELFMIRLKDYQKAWKIAVEQLKEVDLKKEFVEVLNHLIADIALYFGMEQTNTLDIIDALDQKLFPEETKKLLKEAVSTIYRMRVRLHLDSKEQKELLTPGKNEQKTLSYILWLVLSPLYAYVQEIVANETFVPINLIEKAIELLIQPDTELEVRKIKPSVAPLVQWLLESQVSVEKHEEIYRKLSIKTILEPLREQYLRALSDKSLIRHLASIPNRDGYRQSFRIDQQSLLASIEQLCLDPLQPPELYAEIEVPGLAPKQLNPEIVKEFLDFKTGTINPFTGLEKEYYNCRHTVRSIREYDLHLKERPDHPCMEYAIGSLTHRLFNHGPPPSLLVKIIMHLQDKIISYPVLISRTVSGNIFDPADADLIDSEQLTEILISQILTLPGDANARNFIRQSAKLISIDNDVCFVEPIIQLKEGWVKTRQVQLTSVLFCLKNEIQLDLRAIERFCDLDPLLILNGWLEDLIAKESAYTALFSDVTERKAFLEKERERSFTPFFILAPGSIARLYEQFLKLQSLFREKRTWTSSELLGTVIGRSDRANLQTSEIGSYIKKAYERGGNLAPKERLRQAVDRDISQSMTSNKALEAQLGKVPVADELEKREAFSPEQAKTELFALSFQRCTELGMIVHTGDKATFKSCFQQMTRDEQPDLERQRLVLFSLIGALPKNMTALNLSHCAALNDDQLERIVSNFPHLKALDLRYCPFITGRSVEKIAELLPNLEELYLSGCPKLVAIEKGVLFKDALSFKNLKVLHAAHCPKLVRLNIAAIKLKELKINGSGDLSSGVLSIVNLHTPMLEALNCSFLKDYEKVKALKTLKQLKFKDPSLTDEDLFIIFKNNPDLVELDLIGCLNITQLPPSNLQTLYLKHTSISKIEGKYPALAVLKIESCGELATIQLNSPKLRHLEAQKCLKLHSLQIEADRLTTLNLSESPQVEINSANLLTYPSLEYLDLSFNKMLTKAFLEEVLALPQLKQLYLNHCSGIGPELNLQAPSLSHLHLKNCGLEKLAIDAANLQHLNVGFNSDLFLGEMALPLLETLDVRNCEKLSLEFLEHLPGHWRKIFSITVNDRLEIETVIKKIGSLGSIQIDLRWDRHPLADFLIFLKEFHQAIFAIQFFGKLEAEGTKALASVLPKSQINQLDLWNNSIGVKGTKALASALPKSQVTKLALGRNSIGDEGARALASALPKSQVTQLRLEYNGIGDEGTKALASALPKSQVTQFKLIQNNIGDKGAKALASTLPKSQVTQLDLTLNNIGTEGAKAFASTLSKSQVTQLNLGGNSIGDEGAKALANTLPKSQITRLDLQRNSIGNEGVNAFASALPKSKVTQLNLEYNYDGI